MKVMLRICNYLNVGSSTLFKLFILCTGVAEIKHFFLNHIISFTVIITVEKTNIEQATEVISFRVPMPTCFFHENIL